jgi:hypothetical protein
MERHSLNLISVAQVLEKENLQKAWKQVKANKGAPGIDNISIEEFPEYAFRHWEGIKTALLEGTYQPAPVKRVEIPKHSGGGTRPLGIPTVLDRVIEQAISQVLTSVFDPHFRSAVSGSVPTVPPIRQCARWRVIYGRDTATPWTSTSKSSSIRSTSTY